MLIIQKKSTSLVKKNGKKALKSNVHRAKVEEEIKAVIGNSPLATEKIQPKEKVKVLYAYSEYIGKLSRDVHGLFQKRKSKKVPLRFNLLKLLTKVSKNPFFL